MIRYKKQSPQQSSADRASQLNYINQLQLPPDATWVDIADAQNERYRLEKIEQYKLPADADWKQILEAERSYIGSTRIPK